MADDPMQEHPAKAETTANTKTEGATKPLAPPEWARSLLVGVVVGLIVLAGQIFVNPITARRVMIQESTTQKRYEVCERAIELLQRRLASATWTGPEVPSWYVPPEQNPPTQLEFNVAYNLLLIYGKSPIIADEFLEATKPAKTRPADIVKFLSAVRKELGVDKEGSIDKIAYRFLRPTDGQGKNDPNVTSSSDPAQ